MSEIIIKMIIAMIPTILTLTICVLGLYDVWGKPHWQNVAIVLSALFVLQICAVIWFNYNLYKD